MENHQDKKKDLLQRLKTTQGHIGGVMRMIEEEKNCLDILAQVNAIKAAINKIESSILENYLHKCLKESLAQDDRPEKIVENLSKVINKLVR